MEVVETVVGSRLWLRGLFRPGPLGVQSGNVVYMPHAFFLPLLQDLVGVLEAGFVDLGDGAAAGFHNNRKVELVFLEPAVYVFAFGGRGPSVFDAEGI